MSNAEDMERAVDRAIDLCEERIAFLEERVLDRQAERDDLKRAAQALLDALPECERRRLPGLGTGICCAPYHAAGEIKALEALL